MVQTRQFVCSTKPNTSQDKFKIPPVVDIIPESSDVPTDTKSSNELHIRIEHIRKVYTNDTGRFPVRLRNGNQYIFIAYHFHSLQVLRQQTHTASLHIHNATSQGP